MLHNQCDVFQDEWRALDTVVADSRNVWEDRKRSEFDKIYWQEMVQVVNEYLIALYEVADTVEYIEQNIP